VFDLSSGHDQTAGSGVAAREDGSLTLQDPASDDFPSGRGASTPSYGRLHMTIVTLADALAADDKVARSAYFTISPACLAEKPRLKRVLFACEAASDPGQFTTRPN
jgi:hypothetical protein